MNAKLALKLTQNNKDTKLLFECFDIIENEALKGKRKAIFGLLKEDQKANMQKLWVELTILGFIVEPCNDGYINISW